MLGINQEAPPPVYGGEWASRSKLNDAHSDRYEGDIIMPS